MRSPTIPTNCRTSSLPWPVQRPDPNGGQIYIDGFTGGQLPPKSSIREIRINQNPFSAQYDKLGYGRIEILTKPGTDKLHGMFMINGNDSTFNSLNPFVTNEPPYYSTFIMGNAGGALTKKASWFASVFRRDNQSNSIVNAELLDSTGSAYNYTAGRCQPTVAARREPALRFPARRQQHAHRPLHVRPPGGDQQRRLAVCPGNPGLQRDRITRTPFSSATPRC